MKPLKVYVAGRVSPDSSLPAGWRGDFCRMLEEKSGFKIINLDPTSRKDMPFDPQMIFGRDCFLIRESDLVVVNLTDDISVGSSQEMLIAKYFNKPLLGVAKEGGKFLGQHNDFGRIVDFIHPFVFAPCDGIVNDAEEAGEWIKKNFGKQKPKGIGCVDESIEYYLKNYFDRDEFAKKYF